MEKAVLISIRPKWCELIANSEKTIEIRKNRPRLAAPFKCYVYCTKGNIDIVPKQIWWKKDKTGFEHIMNGKVIGEFICDHIDYVRNYGDCVDMYDVEASCLLAMEIVNYAKDKDGNFVYTFGWHISELKIYDEPKELSAFGLKRPPQSWSYVNALKEL